MTNTNYQVEKHRDPDCVFCKIVAGELEPKSGPIVDREDSWVAFHPGRQHVPGHILFVPDRHVSDAFEGPATLAYTMFQAAKWGKQNGYEAANLITSIGAESTQTVFHLHVHLLPRGASDGLRPSWPWRFHPGEQPGPNEIKTQAELDADS